MTRMLKLTGIVFITFQLSLAQARTSNKPEPCNIPEKTVMRTEGSVAGYQIEFIPYKHHAVLQFQHSTQEYTIVIPLGHPPRHEGKPHHHHGKPHHGRPHHGKPHHGKHHGTLIMVSLIMVSLIMADLIMVISLTPADLLITDHIIRLPVMVMY